jgi:hypothetical protein
MPSHEALSGEPALRADAQDLRSTLVTPALDEPLAAGKNVLYCSTLTLAWKELIAHLGGAGHRPGLRSDEPSSAPGPVKLTEPCPTADRLDRAAQAAAPGDLDEASYVARAGVGPRVIDAVRADLARKFGGAASPSMVPTGVSPDEIVVYAYLFKNLAFADPFLREDTWGLAFAGKHQVRHFGLWGEVEADRWEKMARQIVVRDHRSDEDFVVELTTRSTGDRLVVARVPPQATLGATVDHALERAEPSLFRRLAGGRFRKQDELRVPVIDFDVLRRYVELCGKRLAARGNVIAEAAQSIRFRLDDKGALLKSEAFVGAPKGGLRPQFPPRRFVCDGPFLVMMARAGSRAPYFALWIDDTELLLPCPPLPAPAAVSHRRQ